MEAEVECLYDEVITLKTAIEEAIIKGRKSVDLLSDIPESDVGFDGDFAITCVGGGPGIVGWIDDF